MKRSDKSSPSAGDIDAQLTAYFRSEMPKTWPAFQPPTSRKVIPFRQAASERPRFVLSSRLALAASIALLLLCGWLLSGVLSVPYNGGGSFPGASDPVANDKGKGHRLPHVVPDR